MNLDNVIEFQFSPLGINQSCVHPFLLKPRETYYAVLLCGVLT